MFNSRERKMERMRSGATDTLSANTYNGIIGGVLFWGFFVNVLIVHFCGDMFMAMNPWTLIIGYFISCLLGIFMAAKSNNPVVSFIGYNLVVVPVGAVLSVVLQEYSSVDIKSAFLATAGVTVVMMTMATVKPQFFAGMGRTLFFSLLIGLIAEVVCMLFGIVTPIFNWLFVVIFSLYIGYDWHKAQCYPKTLDNAVDSALDIYLDIINLFIRLLEIFGKSDD